MDEHTSSRLHLGKRRTVKLPETPEELQDYLSGRWGVILTIAELERSVDEWQMDIAKRRGEVHNEDRSSSA